MPAFGMSNVKSVSTPACNVELEGNWSVRVPYSTDRDPDALLRIVPALVSATFITASYLPARFVQARDDEYGSPSVNSVTLLANWNVTDAKTGRVNSTVHFDIPYSTSVYLCIL
jgi:hypothetical protein